MSKDTGYSNKKRKLDDLSFSEFIKDDQKDTNLNLDLDLNLDTPSYKDEEDIGEDDIIYNHQIVELTMSDYIKELYPNNIIPKGTLLYHGSTEGNLLDNLNNKKLFFGLDPSISIWYTLELYENNKGDNLFLYVFSLNEDLPFVYLEKFNKEYHPDNVNECLENPCLHPQFAYHGDPNFFDLSQKYFYTISLELTIPNIKSKIDSNIIIPFLDNPLVIDKHELVSLKYKHNKDSLNNIFINYSYPSSLNEKILFINTVNDDMISSGKYENIIDTYDEGL